MLYSLYSVLSNKSATNRSKRSLDFTRLVDRRRDDQRRHSAVLHERWHARRDQSVTAHAQITRRQPATSGTVWRPSAGCCRPHRCWRRTTDNNSNNHSLPTYYAAIHLLVCLFSRLALTRRGTIYGKRRVHSRDTRPAVTTSGVFTWEMRHLLKVFWHLMTLILDLSIWKVAHQLLLPWRTLKPISVFLRLFVFEYEAVRYRQTCGWLTDGRTEGRARPAMRPIGTARINMQRLALINSVKQLNSVVVTSDGRV